MDFDYRRRCACLTMIHGGLEYETIRYGLVASEMGDDWYNMDSPWTKDYARGRRPGDSVPINKHYFNKRVMTREESIGGVPRGSDADRVAARYGSIGPRGAPQGEAAGGGAGVVIKVITPKKKGK